MLESDYSMKIAETPKTIKIGSYNLWNARAGKEIFSYLRETSCDIWCLQEVNSSIISKIASDKSQSDMHEEIRKILPHHLNIHSPVSLYCTHSHHEEWYSMYGLSIFSDIRLPVVETRTVYLNGHFHERYFSKGSGADHVRLIQIITYRWPGRNKPLNCLNYHGVWYPAPEGVSSKRDTKDRIDISKKIHALMRDLDGDVVLVGDFNLEPDTESIKLIGSGMKDLIKEYRIKTTRSQLYDKPEYPWADYAFVSNGLKVRSFEVPKVNHSDHLPLILEIDL